MGEKRSGRGPGSRQGPLRRRRRALARGLAPGQDECSEFAPGLGNMAAIVILEAGAVNEDQSSRCVTTALIGAWWKRIRSRGHETGG